MHCVVKYSILRTRDLIHENSKSPHTYLIYIDFLNVELIKNGVIFFGLLSADIARTWNIL